MKKLGYSLSEIAIIVGILVLIVALHFPLSNVHNKRNAIQNSIQQEKRKAEELFGKEYKLKHSDMFTKTIQTEDGIYRIFSTSNGGFQVIKIR